MRFLCLVFVFSLALFSREDPFVPLVTPKESMRPYYGETRVFDREEITLPSNARLIKKVEVTYQNIDGSIEKKSLDLSGRIDWRLPLVLSQTLDSPPKNAPKSTKSGAKNEAKRAKNAEDSHKNSTQDSRGLDSPEDSHKDSPKNGAKTAAAAKSPAKDSPQKATNPKDSSAAKNPAPSDDEAIFLLEESRTKLRKQKDSRESSPSGNLEQGAIIENAAIAPLAGESSAAGFNAKKSAAQNHSEAESSAKKSAPQVATNAPTSAANHSSEKSSVQKSAANAAQSAAKKNLGADSARNSGANPMNLADSATSANPPNLSNPATATNRANPKTPATSATAANLVNPKSPANPAAKNANATNAANPAPAEPNLGANPEPKIVAAPPAPKNYPNPKNAAFIAEAKSLFIAYDGALQRHFMMKNPSRIVLDFDKNMSFYKPSPLRVDKPHFRSIRYGLHDGFLRVVVELEGSYVYGVAKMANGVVVNVE